MNFINLIGSVFNFQTVLFVLGMIAIITGVWIQLGVGIGLVALGASLITTALIINRNSSEGR